MAGILDLQQGGVFAVLVELDCRHSMGSLPTILCLQTGKSKSRCRPKVSRTSLSAQYVRATSNWP